MGSSQLPAGARIGAYQIVKLLGEGGMGFVYEATHEVLRRRTAIKLLRPELAGHEQVVTRFLQEARAVNLIDHPHIVNVYDYGDGSDGSVYFVMEFLEGETLDDLMRKRRPMATPLLLHVFGQLLQAMAAAHAKQIVHRDLKPANVYVTPREGNPYFIKVLDFGIAQLRGEGAIAGLTVAGSVMGTPQYMSPEQISGRSVDARTDVWALGVMLYRAATGAAPFRGEGFAELAGKILHETPTRASERVPGVPRELDELIARCLERDLDKRCASVAEMIAGLERVARACGLDDDAIRAAVAADSGAATEPLPVMASEPTRGSLVESRPIYQGVPQTPARSRRGLVIGASAAAVAVAVGGWVAFGRGSSAPAATRALEASAPAAAEPGAAIHDAIASGDLAQQLAAVEAVALTGAAKAAPELYVALGGRPELRVKAARALAGLGLPDAAPKVRAALDASGDKVRVDLAASLLALGDQEGMSILRRATTDVAQRLTAAVALAEAHDESARPVLAEIVAATPEGRESWRRAAAGLVRLGDDTARKALAAELARPEAARAVAAAEVLAGNGDAKARAYLVRVAADADFDKRGDASLALARLGEAAALRWLATGFASPDAGERRTAIAICAHFASHACARDVARLAADDTDPGVRLAADAARLAL